MPAVTVVRLFQRLLILRPTLRPGAMATTGNDFSISVVYRELIASSSVKGSFLLPKTTGPNEKPV